jgi:gamma-glutamyltranspeptidase/glutathione hydrolase
MSAEAAAAVPGELVGLLELHRRAGRVPLREVVAPAVAWARDGFTVSPQIAMIIALVAPIARRSPAVAKPASSRAESCRKPAIA